MNISMYMYIYIIYIYVYICILYEFVEVFIYIHTYICIYMQLYGCVYIYVYVYIPTFVVCIFRRIIHLENQNMRKLHLGVAQDPVLLLSSDFQSIGVKNQLTAPLLPNYLLGGSWDVISIHW